MRRTKNTLMVAAGILIGMLISVPAVSAASAAPATQPVAPTAKPTVAPTTVTPTPSPAATQDYIISVDHWSCEDFSQRANPVVFTGYYDREPYNTIRQTLLDGTSQNPAYTMVAKGEDYSAVVNVLGRMSGVKRYEHHTPNNFRKGCLTTMGENFVRCISSIKRERANDFTAGRLVSLGKACLRGWLVPMVFCSFCNFVDSALFRWAGSGDRTGVPRSKAVIQLCATEPEPQHEKR